VTGSEQRTGCSAGHLQIQQSRRSRTRTGDPFITRQRRVRHGRPRETTEVHKVPGKRPIRSPWVQTLELARARPYVPDSYPTRPRRRAGGTSLPGTENSAVKSAFAPEVRLDSNTPANRPFSADVGARVGARYAHGRSDLTRVVASARSHSASEIATSAVLDGDALKHIPTQQ